jgi:hypothetical protein
MPGTMRARNPCCVPATSELTDCYTVGKFHVWIHLAADGKVDSIIYTRNETEGEFTDLERKTLMDRNCGKLSWISAERPAYELTPIGDLYYKQYWTARRRFHRR